MANRFFWLEIVDKLRDWIDNRIETKGSSLDAQYDQFANTRAFTSVHNRTGYLLETEFYGYVTDFGDQFLDKTRETTPSYDDFRMEIRKGRLSNMQQMIDNFPESVSDADKELYSQFLKDNIDFSIADEGSMRGLYGLALDYNMESTQRYADGYFEANKLATRNKLVEKYGVEEYNRLYGLLVDRNSPSFGNFVNTNDFVDSHSADKATQNDTYERFVDSMRQGRLEGVETLVEGWPSDLSEIDKAYYKQFLLDDIDFSMQDDYSLRGLYDCQVNSKIEGAQGFLDHNRYATQNKLIEKYGVEEYDRLHALLVDRDSPSFGNFEAVSKSVTRELPYIDYGSGMQSQTSMSL